MSTYNQQSVEIAIKQLISPFSDPKYNNLYNQDQETSNNKEIAKVDKFTSRAKKTINKAQRIQILEVIKEVKTKLVTKTKLVAGIKTLLDIITIISQYRREDNQESYNK